jgi:L-seryl-tRNA(Ser) seleniumtransferase
MEHAIQAHGRATAAAAVRAALEDSRPAWFATGVAPVAEDVAEAARLRLETQARPSLLPAINATGVILHTGLGRAVAPYGAICGNCLPVLTGHSTLEIDPATGERGSRQVHVERHLCALTGAEAGMAVNNDAGAVLLALAAVAAGREVIVSRGELVEIGGGFRIPEVLEQSGARLVEVGTTNKTRAADYERAITPDTAAILKVHPSNYRIEGFTESAGLPALAEIGRRRGVPLLDDLGGGALVDLSPAGLNEPSAPQRIAEGADLVLFSGDKLMGGPQAGIAVGRRDLIGAMKAHPLARALRCDKVTLALLEGTLLIYRGGREWQEIPTLAALGASVEAVAREASELARKLRAAHGVSAKAIPSVARVGAGAAPQHDLPSRAVALEMEGFSASALAARLRTDYGIFGRIEDGRLLLDARTLLPADDKRIIQAVRALAIIGATED